MMPNSISYEFPFRTKFGNVYKSNSFKEVTRHKDNFPLNEYNNELPDIFRLDSMTQSTRMYQNPYLNEVLPVDRKEFYKNYEKTKTKIQLIDKIKKSRKLSQEPSILKSIRNEHEHINPKLYKSQSLNNVISSFIKPKVELNGITTPNYTNKIMLLYKSNSPKIGFRLRNEIETSKNEILGDKLHCSPFDKEKVEKLQSNIDSKHSAYLGNINNYNIKENYNENKRCKFEFLRKTKTIYNPITNETKTVKPDNFTNDKWDSYSETFELLKHNLRRKGGLFSEFTNKNRSIFKFQKEEKQFKNEVKYNKNKNKKKAVPQKKALSNK